MEISNACPACGQPNALLALGTRYDHPFRWRPWVTARTHIYLCDRCDALVEIRDTHARGYANCTRTIGAAA